jgi:hypothetical protein
MTRIQCLCVVAVSVAVGVPSASFAQSHPEFIALGRVSAALYRPDNAPAPHVGFVIGTDLFAARDIEYPNSFVEQLKLPAGDLDRILRGNAKRLLHL